MKMIILQWAAIPFLLHDNRSSLLVQGIIRGETERFVCVCLCTVYNVRGLFFCSQPYLTSSQSCYINKNRDFARARFEKSAKKLRAKRLAQQDTCYN